MHFRRTIALAAGIFVLSIAPVAHAEGETIDITAKTCDQISIEGSGYTPGQTVIAFARAPKGEGTITDQKTIIVDGAGNVGSTALVFGGQVPDGTYEAVITTEGENKEEVTERFTMKDCGPGSPDTGTPDEEGGALPFTGPEHVMPTMVIGLALLAAGALLLRRSREGTWQ